MADERNTNGWSKWENHVLLELKRLNECHGDVNTKLDALMKEVSALKVKAGIWGVIGGAVPVIIGLGVWVLTAGG